MKRNHQSSGFLRMPQKFGAIFLKDLILHRSFKPFRKMKNHLTSGFLRMPQKFGAIFLKFLMLHSNIKTLRKIVPYFCYFYSQNIITSRNNINPLHTQIADKKCAAAA